MKAGASLHHDRNGRTGVTARVRHPLRGAPR
jgi:hypothetical protein